MSGMHKWLAEAYGTGQVESPVEYSAGLEMLAKVAEEEGVDLSQFSDDELEELAGEFEAAGDDSGEYYEEYDDDYEDEVVKEAEEKVAEADYLGRVMAHSMVQELGFLNKEASRRQDREGAFASTPAKRNMTLEERRARHAAKAAYQGSNPGMPGTAHGRRGDINDRINERARAAQKLEAAKTKARAEGAAESLSGRVESKLREAGRAIANTARKVPGAFTGLHGRKHLQGAELAKAIAYGGGKGSNWKQMLATNALRGAVVGGGAYAAHKLSKEAEVDAAIEEVAEERALEILADAGYLD